MRMRMGPPCDIQWLEMLFAAEKDQKKKKFIYRYKKI